MYISDFSLNDFRSYRELVIHCEPGVTAFIGENGQGKTNIVEAIEYAATFSSHRVNADAALVRQGSNAAVIRARVNNGSRSSLLEIEILAGRANRARLNRNDVRPAQLLGFVRVVVFAPEDLRLVTGDPAGRRHFLDTLMIQMYPRMRAVKADYEKVLRQRAATIKAAGKARRAGRHFDETNMHVWDEQLVDLGIQIIQARAKIVGLLRPFVAEYYSAVSAQNTVARLDYEANINAATGWFLPDIVDFSQADNNDAVEYVNQREEWMTHSEHVRYAFTQALHELRTREIEAGMNLVGPHRDDIRLGLGSLPAKGFASHGEGWSFALALRLASWQVLRNVPWADNSNSDEPILILDDVFAELDARRRERLATMIEPAEQVFVTAAVGDDVPSNLHARTFVVHESCVKQEGNNSEHEIVKDQKGGDKRDVG